SLLGSGDLTVTARAVARVGTAASLGASLVVLGQASTDASNINPPHTLQKAVSMASNTITAAGKVIVDSNNSDAVDINNAAGSITSAVEICIVGGTGGAGKNNLF